jgi:hypothetical protein
MLGPVLVVDPPPAPAPGSALRLLVVTFQWACSTAVRLTATGRPDPSVDGDGDGHGRLLRAGYIQFHGGRVQSGHRHFDFVLVLLVNLPSAEGLL